MNQWIDHSSALDSLDPISGMSDGQRNRLAYYSEAEERHASAPGGMRHLVAAGLLKVAIMLDGRAQIALTEARGQR
jgi:hypothetical protein